MKKLVSLLLVLTMVLGLATAAFAEEAPAAGSSSDNPIVAAEVPAEISIPAPAEGVTDPVVVWYEFPAELAGYTISITHKYMPTMWEVSYMGPVQFDPQYSALKVVENKDEDDNVVSYTVSYQLPDLSMGGRPMPGAPTTYVLGFGVDYGEAETEAVTLPVKAEEPPVGSQYNHAALELDKEYTVNALESEGYYYFFDYVAVDGGELTIDVSYIAGGDYVDVMLISQEQGEYPSIFESAEGDTATVSVASGDTVILQISGGGEACSVTFTASFEAAPEGDILNPIEIEDQDKDYDFTAKGSGVTDPENEGGILVYYYKLTDIAGAVITIKDPGAMIEIPEWNTFYYADADDDDNDDVLTLYMSPYSDEAVIAVGIQDEETNEFSESVVVNVSEPVGYDENAEVLEDISEFTVTVADYMNYGTEKYYVEWTADAAGKYSFAVDKAEWNADANYGYVPTDDNGDPYPVNAYLVAFVNGIQVEPTAVEASVGDVITVCVVEGKFDTPYGEDGPYPADVTVVSTFDPAGSATNPIRVNDASELGGIEVPAKGTVNYAINSHLNGQILTINVDANATVTLNGKEVKAENGVVTAELTGTPVNTLVVANKGDKAASYVASINWPVGSESNPVEIKNAADLTNIDVKAGESVYYAINSQLNGQILTINVDENTAVTLNGKEVKAENGVVSVELAGTPVNSLVVTNKGEKDASYTASIAYPLGTAGNPIVVNTEKELNGTEIAAGAETHYLLNSKLDGAVLSVKGDKAYVIVDGVKTEAKDGFIKLTLAAKGATISLVVGNAGTEAATVTLGYSDNPNTGDMGVLTPGVTMLMSAMSTVALVIKKKEF